MNLGDIFQLTPIPPNAMGGYYSPSLVLLSYLIASLASYVALDITERIRSSGESISSKWSWLIGGAFAMGMGIWTMHFIGMLAFVMPMPMDYDLLLTVLSMFLGVIASAFAFFLIKNDPVKPLPIMLGGILLGIGIVSMHYTGMSAMLNVHIHYLPGLFALSVAIAIVTSEVALWLMIKSSNKKNKYQRVLKVCSSFVMGFAICGMHYTGIAAAVFTPSTNPHNQTIAGPSINPDSLSFYIAAATVIIMTIALAASRFWMHALQSRNQKLIETEAILEQKSNELQKLNENLYHLAESSKAKEEKIRAILTAAADGIIVVDEKGIIEICNRATGIIFGYESAEMVKQNITKYIGQTREQKFNSLSFSDLIEKKDTLLEYAGRCKNDSIIPIELNTSVSIINNKTLYIIVLRDITERKLAENNLSSLNQQLLSAARLAGMTEVATCVLHNVGNVLNSINISAQILLKRDSSTKIPAMIKLAELIQTNKNNLEIFLKTDPMGKLIPEYLKEFAHYWEGEQNFIHKELESLSSKVQHIKDIIVMQQSLSGGSNLIEEIQVNKLVDDALAINSELVEKFGIIVIRDYDKIPPFDMDKVKTLQTLVNLAKNAAEALASSDKKEKKLTLRTKLIDPDHIQIEVSDNGIGIPSENITKIFSYGFSTKEKGHGFGLHTSALSAQEAGGSLNAFSPGPDLGSTFVLTLPKQVQKEIHNGV